MDLKKAEKKTGGEGEKRGSVFGVLLDRKRTKVAVESPSKLLYMCNSIEALRKDGPKNGRSKELAGLWVGMLKNTGNPRWLGVQWGEREEACR